MASLGHVAVGLAAGRRWSQHSAGRKRETMLVCVLLAVLPDADVIAFKLGIPYAAPWGHRGAMHSLVMAVIAGTLLGAPLLRRAPWSAAALFASALVATHGLLDTLTDGGLGIALLWPFSNARYFAPFRPIPVAPIGARMLSGRGLYVVLVEAVLFAPFLLYAAWPRRPSPAPPQN